MKSHLIIEEEMSTTGTPLVNIVLTVHSCVSLACMDSSILVPHSNNWDHQSINKYLLRLP